ncbi:DMT family transporter [Hyphomicrobiales bacterium 4NK60-0047b]
MNHRSAIGLMCLAVLCFSVLDSTAKYLGEFSAVHVVQILWIRFITHNLFLVAIYKPKPYIEAFKSNAPKAQIIRTISMVGATAFNFTALLYLQLDQTIAIFFLSPLLIAMLSGPILGEHLKPYQFYAVLFGFLGVLIVMRPGFGGIHWAVILSLLSTLSVSIYNVLTRYTSHLDNNATNQIMAPIGGALLLTPPVFFYWQTPNDIFTWVLLLSLGISGGLGHWLMITAHRYAPAPLLAPFIYTGIISMPAIGYFVFDDIITWWTFAGAMCVIVSGLYLWYQEHQKADKEIKEGFSA